MKYLCLVYLEADKFTAVPDRECLNCGEDLQKQGLLLAAEPLFPVDTAKTLRIRNGRVAITDGPFAETKEQLAGFYLIDASSQDEAMEIAARIPPARAGSIEVRPVRDLQP
ncbi:MAG TPA: YciI family protein [Vicinamibacterales bacterium]|nr:YciI family protein [Vicinamibacterales bacterium]